VTTNEAAPATAGIATRGQRVFICGHSFLVFIRDWLQEIADSAGIKDHKDVGVSYLGASHVIQIWDVPEEKNEAKTALRAGKVDVLILSPMDEPDIGIKNFAYFAMEYNPHIRVMVQVSWLPSDNAAGDWNAASIDHLWAIHRRSFMDMDQYIMNFNKRLRQPVLFIVPVGQAVIALREKIVAGEAPGLHQQSDLFYDTRGHPQPPLAALVSYCHFAAIYHRSPMGLPIPSLLKKTGYSEELNRLLQQLAWNAVIQHPLSGVTN
jgi:hypothetical protein